MRELKSQSLSGKSQARGRNGWFVPSQMLIWADNGNEPINIVNVEVSSKQRGNLAPILLFLTVEDAWTLASEIAKVVSLCDYSKPEVL